MYWDLWSVELAGECSNNIQLKFWTVESTEVCFNMYWNFFGQYSQLQNGTRVCLLRSKWANTFCVSDAKMGISVGCSVCFVPAVCVSDPLLPTRDYFMLCPTFWVY